MSGTALSFSKVNVFIFWGRIIFVIIIDTYLKVYYVINIHENIKSLTWVNWSFDLLSTLFLLPFHSTADRSCIKCSLNGSIRLLILRIDEESFVDIHKILFEISWRINLTKNMDRLFKKKNMFTSGVI